MKANEKKNFVRVVFIAILIAVIVVISILADKNRKEATPVSAKDTLQLFNGISLEDWTVVLADSLANPDSTFFIRDEKIFTTGQPFGYIRTNESFTDYNLLVEWRWTEQPGNSGVFLHIQEDKIWPVCLECQLKDQNAGDFVCFPGFDFVEHIDKEKWAVVKFEESSEKPAGEWNLYDIRVNRDSISIYVNGTLQNVATATNYTSGHIALQSEGAPLEFRNIMLIQESQLKD